MTMSLDARRARGAAGGPPLASFQLAAGVAEDEDAVVAVGAREQALPLQVAGRRVGRHERLVAPEVVPLGVDVVTDLLDARGTEAEHPHPARVVRAVGDVLAR